MDIIGKDVKLWVNEHETKDGGTFRTYSVSSSGKNKDGDRVYAPVKVFFKRDIDVSRVENGTVFSFEGFSTVDCYKNKQGEEVRNFAIMVMKADFGELGDTGFAQAEEDIPF